MGAFELADINEVRKLVQLAHASAEPLVVLNGGEECLVVMTPSTFERILFDGDLLNCQKRETFRL